MVFRLKLGNKKKNRTPIPEKPIQIVKRDKEPGEYPRYSYTIHWTNRFGQKQQTPLFAFNDKAAETQAKNYVALLEGKFASVERIRELIWMGGKGDASSKWSEEQLKQWKKNQKK